VEKIDWNLHYHGSPMEILIALCLILVVIMFSRGPAPPEKKPLSQVYEEMARDHPDVLQRWENELVADLQIRGVHQQQHP
jgi:hypothetical protein